MKNKLYDAFDSIKASEELKNSTKHFLQAEREKRSSPRTSRSSWGKVLATACAVLVLLVGIGGYKAVTTPVSYISIDVNPSVELALNRYDRVISANAYNDDGELVLAGVDVKGKLYTDAIDCIVESSALQPYLTEDSALTFTVAARESDKEAAIITALESCNSCHRNGGRCETASVDSITEAHENGLSFGKYSAYLILSQYDSSVTAEDCKNMSMAEIRNQINVHENGGEHNGDCGGGHQHGNGTRSN